LNKKIVSFVKTAHSDLFGTRLASAVVRRTKPREEIQQEEAMSLSNSTIATATVNRRRPPPERKRLPRRSLARVLLIEDDHELRAVFTHALNRVGYDVTKCRRGIDFWVLIVASDATGVFAKFDLVICDVRLLNELSIGIIQSLQQRRRYPPLVLIDEQGDLDQRQLERMELAAVIDTPFELTRCMAKIREIVPHR
jgi:CheY-like chemotaxis protein